MIGIFGLDNLEGRCLRTAISAARSVEEAFLLDFAFDLPPERLLPFHGPGAVFTDIRPFAEVPGVGVTLIYRVPIVSSLPAQRVVAAFDLQTVRDAVADAAVADYSKAKPIDEQDFWAVLEPLANGIDSESVDTVVARLAKLPKTRILAFSRRFFDLLSDLSTPEILECHPEVGAFPGDAFLWWRLALLATGQEQVRRVLAGQYSGPLDEADWAGAEELIDICERAWEIRTGVRPQFSNGPVSQFEDTTVQREYFGQRSVQDMIDDDRFPQIVGSRFLVDRGGELSDCVAIQLVDIYSESREQVLASLAAEVATRIGGSVASRVIGRNTYTGSLFAGLTVFRSRRPTVGGTDLLFESKLPSTGQ